MINLQKMIFSSSKELLSLLKHQLKSGKLVPRQGNFVGLQKAIKEVAIEPAQVTL